MKLKDKVAIVTGGAMGNGLGIAKVFLKHGAKVVIFDYSEKLRDTLTSLRAEGYQDISGFIIDLRNKEAVDTCTNKVIEKYGRIDILVNNAGVVKLKPFLETSVEERDFQFDINIKGVWNTSQAVVKHMIRANKGAIVNLSSVTGPMVADSGEVAYATTKSAVLGFTKGLAAELVTNNIRVNAILPGYIMTPMVEGIAQSANNSDPNSVVEGIRVGIPMKRLGTIEELGELAAFLASDEASYITAQGIVIDGGSTLPETMSVGV